MMMFMVQEMLKNVLSSQYPIKSVRVCLVWIKLEAWTETKKKNNGKQKFCKKKGEFVLHSNEQQQ